MKTEFCFPGVVSVILLVTVVSVVGSTRIINAAYDMAEEETFRYARGITVYPWLQQAHDAQRLGFTKSPAPSTNHTLWKFGGDGKDFYISFPTIAYGKVFLAVQVPLPYDHMYALDAATGEQIWKWRPEDLPLGSGFSAAPAVEDGKIYFRTGTSLYCINAGNGNTMWRYNFNKSLGGISGVAADKGRVYGFSMNSVWCVEASYSTGYHPVLRWETFSGDNFVINASYTGIIGSPALGEGLLIGIGRNSGDVFCLNATNGKWLWTVHTGDITQYTPSIYNGMVYYGNNKGDLFCWNASTGEEKWKFHFSLGVGWGTSVAYGLAYAASYDGWFRAFNASTGKIVWEVNNTQAQKPHPFLGYHGVWHAAPAIADGKVYLGGHDGYFYCWNASTGDEIWKYFVGGDVCAGPAVADGRVYVGSYYIYSQYEGQGTGKFYCFGKGETAIKLTLSDQLVSEGQSVLISGSLNDLSPASTASPAIVAVPIKLIAVDEFNAKQEIAVVNSDKQGLFCVTWIPPRAGIYEIVAYFEGTESYGKASTKTILAVKEMSPMPPPPEYPQPIDPTWAIMGGTITVVLAVAIVGLLILRKK